MLKRGYMRFEYIDSRGEVQSSENTPDIWFGGGFDYDEGCRKSKMTKSIERACEIIGINPQQIIKVEFSSKSSSDWDLKAIYHKKKADAINELNAINRQMNLFDFKEN